MFSIEQLAERVRLGSNGLQALAQNGAGGRASNCASLQSALDEPSRWGRLNALLTAIKVRRAPRSF
jgi:hypothetical protein